MHAFAAVVWVSRRAEGDAVAEGFELADAVAFLVSELTSRVVVGVEIVRNTACSSDSHRLQRVMTRRFPPVSASV